MRAWLLVLADNIFPSLVASAAGEVAAAYTGISEILSGKGREGRKRRGGRRYESTWHTALMAYSAALTYVFSLASVQNTIFITRPSDLFMRHSFTWRKGNGGLNWPSSIGFQVHAPAPKIAKSCSDASRMDSESKLIK